MYNLKVVVGLPQNKNGIYFYKYLKELNNSKLTHLKVYNSVF